MIQEGERLYDIAYRHGVSLDALIRTNDLEEPYALEPGQVLLIPKQSANSSSGHVQPVAEKAWDDFGPEVFGTLEPPVSDSLEVIETPAKTASKTSDVTGPSPKPAPSSKPSETTNKLVPPPIVLKGFQEPVAQWTISEAYAPPKNEGVWLTVTKGAPIYAMGGGTVLLIDQSIDEIKTCVFVQHPDGKISIYGGLNLEKTLKKNQTVTEKTLLGHTRNTKFYAEIRKADKNPINPLTEWKKNPKRNK